MYMHCTVSTGSKAEGTSNRKPSTSAPEPQQAVNNPPLPQNGRWPRPHLPSPQGPPRGDYASQHAARLRPLAARTGACREVEFPSSNGQAVFPLASNAAHTLESSGTRPVIEIHTLVTLSNLRLIVPLQNTLGATPSPPKPIKYTNLLSSLPFPVVLLPW